MLIAICQSNQGFEFWGLFENRVKTFSYEKNYSEAGSRLYHDPSKDKCFGLIRVVEI